MMQMRVDRKRLSDEILDYLRMEIVYNRIKPGERIIEREVAESHETSHAPVREALKILEAEGLVNNIKNVGAFVTYISIDDMHAICEIRKTLEILSLDLIYNQINARDIDYLEKMVDSMGNVDLSIEEFVEYDLKFHSHIIKKSRVDTILRFWEVVYYKIVRVLIIMRERFRDYKQLSALHKDLIEALESGDLENAKTRFEEHMDIVWRRIKDA